MCTAWTLGGSAVSREVRLPQLRLPRLAVWVARELGDELDEARTLVVGEVLPHPRDDVVLRQRALGAGLHDREQHLAPLVVGDAEHGAVDDVVVGEQALLDLARV